MPPVSNARSARAKLRNDRARLRAQGLQPVQLLMPAVQAPAFEAEAHRQSRAVAECGGATEDQAFIDAVSVWNTA
ncbi:antitoxin MazE family protein [Methylobacterium sp. J-026]|uniref:antitoxin MazE family protein n=1 Tax=Methylobacterium sp. J-026 TaxID=2836624 RepID=UPI001FBB2967|nr:antitoxin MazE family protein [Methylobacterium sp. J-026]MCJ2137689.1 antitoxin MazE family protein [Methylobacterium sp. J-026]